MLLMSASAQVAAQPWEPPLVPGGTQLGAPTRGGRQGKARPLDTILPFAGTHSHRGCPTASPRHMHSTCLPGYGSCKCQDLWPCPRPGPAAQAAPQHTDPARGHSSRSLPATTDANGPGAHKDPLQGSAPQAPCPAQPGSGHQAGGSSVAGASRRPGCFREPLASRSASHQHCRACRR